MLNVAVLMGRLTADPELRHTQSGIAVTSFTIAINKPVKQEEAPKAYFFNVVAWRNTAEFITKYFSKGKMIIVQGELQTRKWQDRDGNDRETVEVLAQNVNFADSSRSGSDGNTAHAAPSQATEEPTVSVPQPPKENKWPTLPVLPPENAYTQTKLSGDFDSIPLDDDLPF